MKRLLLVSIVTLLPAAGFGAESALQWAYPVAPQGLPAVDNTVKKTVTGAENKLSLTQAEINNQFGPPDWFPSQHPAMPSAVSGGKKPDQLACMLCHLPNGGGHPESASVAGLSASYIQEQMKAFRDGDRQNNRSPIMQRIAKAISAEDEKQAAEYFASIKGPQLKWIRVVEAANAPKNHVGEGGMRFHDKEGGTIPIAANMIYEVPENDEGAENRDQRYGFVDYVPMGSIKKGETLATTGANGKTVQCSICHGEGFKGLGDVPRIAGRSAYYLIRQLNDIKIGARKGNAVALMQPVVKNLSDEDIVNLAAYMASRDPS
jgi:cytochrome c553